jgi:hypothetical protein
VSPLTSLFKGFPQEELVKRGSLEIDGAKYAVFLPKEKVYSTRNTAKSDDEMGNTSTPVFIDQNGDGRITNDEMWFSNLPIRVGDRMYDVTEIAKDGTRISFKLSKAPLSGVVVGRPCPPFSLKTSDGKEVSSKQLAGKAFLLDFWSVT